MNRDNTKDYKKIKKVLLLGSGALKIGEAGEFDYSGSQAAKALKEEHIETILVNPNIATVQTSHNLFVDHLYFVPVTPYFVEKVIKKERPDGIMLGFGGQTALNCGLELDRRGVLKKYHVQVLGSSIATIDLTEDRLLFREKIKSLGLKVPDSKLCKTMKEAESISDTINYPAIVRAGFSLGGLGSGVVRNKKQLMERVQKALALTPQVLIEEYLEHWKELEYEVVRDTEDNTIIICNMENLDPMGIHTGESIVVAPSQTLNNTEYHMLRSIAIKVVKSLPIIGECNIQFALHPHTGEYRIIEVNARLSRSSALASKATGYPLAYVAAKLSLGYRLWEVQNQVTKATSAFFEPALDYVVVKIPRWDFLKFKGVEDSLGSEMQSVGEVMAIDRSFEAALQKAIRSLDMDYEGIISDDLDKGKISGKRPKPLLKNLKPTPDRIYSIAYNLFYGQDIEEIHKITSIDYWFLRRIKTIVDYFKAMIKESANGVVQKDTLTGAKKLGFSDQQIGEVYAKSWKEIRDTRKNWDIVPKICQIDTLAGEFPAQTNYLYFSYHREKDDVDVGHPKQVAVIGGGPYQIGSSVEFDWCAVHAVLNVKKMGFSPIMINCNPETVSTDYDIPDKLYFEELTLERILNIADKEKCPFIVSVGGQIPNSLAIKLAQEGVKMLGTSYTSIDKAENRQKFSSLLDKLHILQPVWRKLTDKDQAIVFAGKIGYPVLVRPSYVLSGRAMFVAYSEEQMVLYLKESATEVTSDYPMVISKFIKAVKEVDFDAVAQNGTIVVHAISEHIEHAGVHSGDASLVLPSFSLSHIAKSQIRAISAKIAKSLDINGPFNIQYLVKESEIHQPEVLVIEANLRASRSFPFVSKVLNENFIAIATRIMLGEKVKAPKIAKPPYFGVKVPHFSFMRLRKADPVLRVEMSSTGEVATFGHDMYEAYLKSVLSTGLPYPENSVLLSLGGSDCKQRMLTGARLLHKAGYKIYATRGTTDFLKEYGIPAEFVYKVHEKEYPNVVDLIKNKKVQFVINLSDSEDRALSHIIKESSDGYSIRRAAVDMNIPLFTKATIATFFINGIVKFGKDKIEVLEWQNYLDLWKLKNVHSHERKTL